MAADVLVTQGARASATMILTLFNHDNSVPACQELILHFTAYHTYIKTYHMEDKIDNEHLFNYAWINATSPGDVMWWQRSGSTLAQVMACCLTAPSHYLNQCWLVIYGTHLHLAEGNFEVIVLDTTHYKVFGNCWRWNIPALGVNIMPADALAPNVNRASPGMVLAV